MYGGYDGSASQFAGQGGFMPTPAGATGTSPGAAAGAVSELRDSAPTRHSHSPFYFYFQFQFQFKPIVCSHTLSLTLVAPVF